MRGYKKFIYIFIVTVIFIGACGVRFYNFPKRINFGPEQAISLITSADYIKDKFSLVGMPNLQRVTSDGHILFSGSLFNYSLIPILGLFNFDPIFITAYFAVLNLITGLLMYFLVLKMIGQKVAIFSTTLFLFNSYMVAHSLLIFIINYMPLIGLLTIYCLFKFRKKQNMIYPLLLGLLSGLGFNLEYFYIFTLFLVLGLLVWISRSRLKNFILFVVGIIVINLPLILFDLRHQFYHLLTVWQYFLDTLNNPGQSRITDYHFLQYWPLVFIIGGLLLAKLFKSHRVLTILLILVYLYLNLHSPQISFQNAVGMGHNFNIASWEKAAEIIASDNPGHFNVAALLDFDSRAHPLRYYLRYKYNMSPESYEEYHNLDNLYVVAKLGYDFDQAIAFEINDYKPFKKANVYKLNSDYAVYKLTSTGQ